MVTFALFQRASLLVALTLSMFLANVSATDVDSPSNQPCSSGWDARFASFAPNGFIWSVKSDSSGNIYVAGDFTSIGGVSANRIAKWDGTRWSSLGSGLNGSVYTVTVSGSNVLVGGSFTTAGGSSANRVALWNGSSWSSYGTGADDTVWAVEVIGSDVFAAGEFLNIGGNPANRIARWNGTSWSVMGTGVNSPAFALKAIGTKLYVGGSFSSANGVSSTSGIASWESGTWSSLGTGLNAGEVYTLADIGGILHVGGKFTGSGATQLTNIARWNGSAWSAIGSGVPTAVVSMSSAGSLLYVGSDFAATPGSSSTGLFKYDGSAWSVIRTGLDSPAVAIHANGTDVTLGGFFGNTGCDPSPRIARLNEDYFESASSSDWHQSSNWKSGAVPTASSSISVFGTTVNISSANAVVGDLQIEEGATLNIASGRTLTVAGNINVLGTIAGDGELILDKCEGPAVFVDPSTGKSTALIRRCVSGTESFVFPVGTSNGYSPVTISNASSDGTIAVRAVGSAYSSATGLPDNRIARYWSVSNSGVSSANVSFKYLAGDVTAGNEASYKLFRVSGGAASQVFASIDFQSRVATANGVTQFSDWTLAESGPACAFGLTPLSSTNVSGSGGTLSISVSTTAECSWIATSQSDWITVTSGSFGTGNGTVNLSVAANTGDARSGSVIIGGETLLINQAAPANGSIAGTVRYFFGQNPVAVPGVTLSATGSQNTSGTSGSNGTFNITGFASGAYTLTPSKTGGATTTHISSLDASAVAQFSVGLISLTANQQIATDVSGDGTISSLDASRIAQWSVGLTLPAGDLTGTWKFAPATRTYSSVTESLTGQDFTAILMGDVSGNWTAPASVNSGAVEQWDSGVHEDSEETVLKGQELAKAIGFELPPSELRIPGIRSSWTDSFRDKSCIESRGGLLSVDKAKTLSADNCLLSTDLIEVPISIGDAMNILAYDAVIAYDSDILEPVFERPVESNGTLSANFNIVVNRSEPGKLRLGAYGIVPVTGEGDLIVLRFRVKRPNAKIEDAKLEFESLVINEESIISSQSGNQ